jgi:hypothetical protein
MYRYHLNVSTHSLTVLDISGFAYNEAEAQKEIQAGMLRALLIAPAVGQLRGKTQYDSRTDLQVFSTIDRYKG